MASPIVRTLLASLFVLSVVATFHCTIDHIPHVYCNSKDDCDQDPYRSCDVVHHTCYDADGGVPLGDMPELSGPDMFCLSSAQCSDDAPICAKNLCRACMDSSDDLQCAAHNPATPRCNSPSGKCVQCLMSSDCPTATPVCTGDPTFTCRKCAANSECASSICAANGSCVDPSDIAYVNNGSSACSEAPHSSSPTAPFCQVSTAAMVSGKPYILVSASATAYGLVTLAPTTPVTLTIVGPAARGTATRATIASTAVSMPAVLVTTSTAAVNLVLDGLEINGANGTTTKGPGVQCSGNLANVTVKNSTIVNSGNEGVNSGTGCTLTLDSNIISFNGNEGIKLVATTYVITNNIIDHNGSGGLPGVNISDSASTGTFAFNTVAANGGANAVEGGIECPVTGTVSAKIENSIVAQNAHNPMTNGTQFLGKCVLSNVVTGPDTFSGANQAVPAFVSMADFHLDTSATGLTMNQACCIDQIASATTPNANHDVDDGPRPKAPGTKLDTGAHEAK